jgi:uncharacterized protein (DUF433 family)
MPIATAQVISDPTIHRGEPVIDGTSTTVRAIVELWNQGMPSEEIPIHLPHLELVQVFEALRYYLINRDEIDQFIIANQIPEDLHGKCLDPRTGDIR